MIDFEGFEPANTTPVPDILFDELLPELTEAELKILLYIIRRTWGFKKVTDAISLNQFQHGITTRDGKVLDKGCGIKNRTTLVKNLASLEKRKCIQSEKGTDAKGDKATTLYSICFKNNGVVRKTYQGSAQNVPPVVTEAYHRSAPSGLPVVRKTYPQETVIQETVIQETVIQESTNAPSDEDRLPTREESVTDIKQVAPDVQANLIRLQAQQQGEHHAETSRALVEVSTGQETSHAALGAVPRESPVPGEARITDERHTNVDTSHRASPRDGAVGPATPQGSRPRASGKGKEVTQAVPSEVVRIMDEWDSLHKKPFPRTEKHIQAAALLVACHPTKDELQQCERWLYSTDRPEKPWYRKHGVRLQDIAENIGKWQSLQDAPEPANTKTGKPKEAPGLTPEQQAHYDELKAKYPKKKAEVQA